MKAFEGKEKYDSLAKWFKGYVDRTPCPDDLCRRQFEFKLAHSFRVVDEAAWIAAELHLNAEEELLAKTTALLHDVGRFEQFRRFRTFNDRHSLDHGDLAVQIIIENHLLADVEPEEQKLIQTAIFYHNKSDLPDHQSRREALFCRLLRDADKLDILASTIIPETSGNGANPNRIPLKPLTQDVSEVIYEDLVHGRNANYGKLQSRTDFLLAMIGWIFDLNFPPTFRRYAQREYFENIASRLPHTPKVSRILSKAHAVLIEKTEPDHGEK